MQPTFCARHVRKCHPARLAGRWLAATNTERLESNNQSSNVGLGVTFGFGQQSGISFQIAASQAKGKASGSETPHDNTRVTAGETLTVKSGGDTTLKGAAITSEADADQNHPAGQAATKLLANLGGHVALPKNQNETSQN